MVMRLFNMKLPFSPTFLRKMEVFQELVEYEEQNVKKLWGGEKAFLIWAASENHQHLGSEVGKDHLQNALDQAEARGFIKERDKNFFKLNGRHIVESLVTHNMATLIRYASDKDPRIKFHTNGILAGQILTETKNFKETTGYHWLYKLSKIKVETVLSLLALVIALLGFLQGNNALSIAQNANSIAVDANKLAADANVIQSKGLSFSQDERSQRYVEDVFNTLYQNPEHLKIVQKIKENEVVEDKDKLTFVLDYLESTGSSFCQGTVWKWHINTTLKNTLEGACNNDQIVSEYSGRKNGLAMLCKEMLPESKFAQSLQTYNLHTCVFHDSSVLKSLLK